MTIIDKQSQLQQKSRMTTGWCCNNACSTRVSEIRKRFWLCFKYSRFLFLSASEGVLLEFFLLLALYCGKCVFNVSIRDQCTHRTSTALFGFGYSVLPENFFNTPTMQREINKVCIRGSVESVISDKILEGIQNWDRAWCTFVAGCCQTDSVPNCRFARVKRHYHCWLQ